MATLFVMQDRGESVLAKRFCAELQTGRADLQILRGAVGELRAAVAQVERLVPAGGAR